MECVHRALAVLASRARTASVAAWEKRGSTVPEPVEGTARGLDVMARHGAGELSQGSAGRVGNGLFLKAFLTILPLLCRQVSFAQSGSTPTTLSIVHRPVACAVAGKFPRLEAGFAPPGTVANARIVFQGQTADWYSVAMKPEGSVFAGVLPMPKRDLKSFRYYIEVTDEALATNRTADFTAAVVDSSSACHGKLTAGSLGSASVLLQGPAGGLAVPAGFAPAGVIAGGATSVSTAGAAGAAGASGGPSADGVVAAGATAGGGLSTAAVIGIVAGAGGVAAAVASRSGEENGGSPSGPSLSGQWVGTWRDSEQTPQCGTLAFSTTLPLTQSGNALSGAMTNLLTTPPPAPNCAALGSSFSGPLTSGSVSGASVQFVATLTSVSPTRIFTFTGSVSGSSPGSVLTGTYVTTIAEFPQFSARGTLSATKQ